MMADLDMSASPLPLPSSPSPGEYNGRDAGLCPRDRLVKKSTRMGV